MRAIRLLPTATLAVLLLALSASGDWNGYGAGRAWVAGRTYSGEVLDCDLPGNLHMKNIGSRRDGAGMCVMTSIEMAAILQGLEKYRGLRDWCAREPGGGYPSKVDQQLAAYCKSKNLPAPKYLQYEGPDPRPVIEAALKGGRIACITYGWGERYGQSIAHMVCCVKFGGKYGVVLDNNFPGESQYEWMDLDELVRRVRLMQGRERDGWVFVWLEGMPPPPSPHN